MADETRGHVIRGCSICGQVDDHPRHIVYDAVADPRHPGKFIDLSEVRHMDCCAAAGCEHDGSCHRIMAHVREHGSKAKFVTGEQRLRGDDLRAHIVKHGDELAEAHTRASDDRLRESMGAQHAEAYLSGQPPLRDTVQYAAENPGE